MDEWLYADADPVVAVIVLLCVGYWTLISPLLLKRRSDPVRVGRSLRRQYYAQVGVVGFLLLLAPGVRSANLGLAPPVGLGLPPGWHLLLAAGLTAATCAVAILASRIARARRVRRGRYARFDEAYQQRILNGAMLGAPRDAFVYLVLPLFAAGILDWPILVVAAGAAALFTFAHRHYPWRRRLMWGLTGLVSVAGYLMAGNVFFPATVLTVVAGAWVLAVPARPVPADPAPPLTVIGGVVGISEGGVSRGR